MRKDTLTNIGINTMERDTLKHVTINTIEKDILNIDTIKRDSLNNVDLNTKVQIQSFNCTGSLRRRLLDLGLIKGTYITPILISPSR